MNYITKLVENGYKVAICEQLSEPTKGALVERGVVRVVTPGTLQENLEDKKNNYLCSIYESKGERPPISIYTIVSPSMVPTIEVYDVVINTALPYNSFMKFYKNGRKLNFYFSLSIKNAFSKSAFCLKFLMIGAKLYSSSISG